LPRAKNKVLGKGFLKNKKKILCRGSREALGTEFSKKPFLCRGPGLDKKNHQRHCYHDGCFFFAEDRLGLQQRLCQVRDKGLSVKTSSLPKNSLRSLCRGQLSAKPLPRVSGPLILGKACESISVGLSSYMICLHSRCSHLFVPIILYFASYIRYFFHRNYRYKHSYGYIHLKLVPELDIYSKSYMAYLNITLRMLTRDQACRS